MHASKFLVSCFAVNIGGHKHLSLAMKSNLKVETIARKKSLRHMSGTFSICKSTTNTTCNFIEKNAKKNDRNHNSSSFPCHNQETIISKLNFFGKRKCHTSSDGFLATKKEPAEQSKSKHVALDSPTNLAPCISNFVGLDCEMVECSFVYDFLARASVVDHEGRVLVDVYVKPTLPITDYRTNWSGITPEVLASKPCASHGDCKQKILQAIKGKVVVGHSLDNDLRMLDICLPRRQVVDISRICAVRDRMLKETGKEKLVYSLKLMSQILLNRSIQKRGHCSVEDATATIDIFKTVFNKWSETNSHILYDMCESDDSYLADRYWPDHITNSVDD